MSLLEPNHANLIYPYVLENSKIASKFDGEKLTYSNEKNAFLKLEETYAYQQND